MEIKNIAYLNWFLIDFVWPPTEFVQGCVGILPVNHNNIGTTPWRNHLDTKVKCIKIIEAWVNQ